MMKLVNNNWKKRINGKQSEKKLEKHDKYSY